MKYILIALTLIACAGKEKSETGQYSKRLFDSTYKVLGKYSDFVTKADVIAVLDSAYGHGIPYTLDTNGRVVYIVDTPYNRRKSSIPCPPGQFESEWNYKRIDHWMQFNVDGIERHDLITVVDGDSITYYFRGPKYKYDTMLVNEFCGKTIYVNGAYAKELKSKK